MTNDTIRTAIRDAVLAGVSAECSDEQVRGIEWGALQDTRAVCLSGGLTGSRSTLLDFEEYAAVEGAL